jgi:hypothetical protein
LNTKNIDKISNVIDVEKNKLVQFDDAVEYEKKLERGDFKDESSVENVHKHGSKLPGILYTDKTGDFDEMKEAFEEDLAAIAKNKHKK